MTVAVALILVLPVLASVAAAPAAAIPVKVTTEDQLRYAWERGDVTVVELASDIALDSCAPLTRDQPHALRVDGAGRTLHQSCAPSAFVSSGTGSVHLHDLRIVGAPHADPGATVASGDVRLERVTVTGAPGDAVRSTGRVTAIETVITGSGGNALTTSHGPVGDGSTVSCAACRLLENDGNGILALGIGATVTVSQSEIAGNGFSGVVGSAGPWIIASTVAHNELLGVNTAGYLRVLNSTIVHNGLDGLRSLSAVGPGQNGTIAAVFSTVVGNGEHNLRATNQAWTWVSVVAGAGVANCSAAQTTGSASFADDTSCALDQHSQEGPGIDPRLGRLAYNGGATPTMRPLRDSPVIAGAAWDRCADWVENWYAEQDQRGWSRPAVPGGPCDIGAVQLGGSAGELCPERFADVPEDHTFCRDIDWMAGNGLGSGWPDGTFRPGLDMSRQALAAFLWRLAGSPEAGTAPAFVDVPDGHDFAPAIAWMAESGISEGYDDGTFRPGAPITRQALAAMLWRLAERPAPPPGSPTFHDVPAAHRFHTPISWLASVEVTAGYDDGGFHPGARTSRQAMSAFLHRFDGVHQVPRP